MKKIYLTAAGAILAGCTMMPAANRPVSPLPNDDGVFCTQEAKLCPDGSYVGRTGPNCEFTACPEISYQTFSSANVIGLAGPFSFTASIPAGWQAEAVPAIEAINIFNSAIPGGTNLEKSQIFIRHFSANTFLTLSTVTIHAQTASTINGHSAVIYDIEKKPGVAAFASQPLWRNARHLVTDIRKTESGPSVFYVIAKNPELSQAVYDQFIQTLQFTTEQQTSVVWPIADGASRITKKSFGTYVTPKNSPVQPEKFTGYHTGIDLEYDDVAGDVPVVAIADGTVVRSGTVSGYGGMVAVAHELSGKKYVAVYGHLDPKTIPANGTTVTKNQQLGLLGDGYTPETSGERKHLHFSLHSGSDVVIAGYVQNASQLSGWVDPLTILP